jgi:hypothetical protein
MKGCIQVAARIAVFLLGSNSLDAVTRGNGLKITVTEAAENQIDQDVQRVLGERSFDSFECGRERGIGLLLLRGFGLSRFLARREFFLRRLIVAAWRSLGPMLLALGPSANRLLVSDAIA